MNPNKDTQETKQLIQSASDIVVILGQNAAHDVVAAGLSLYLSLLNSGKRVTIASEQKVTVELTDLIGVDKISSVLGNKNFVISLDYNEDSIEKVSYHVDSGKFNLVIEPREGAPMLDQSKVKYSHSGFATDLIFAMGAQSVEQLGNFYTNNKAIFADKPIIVIDTKLTNRRFGKVNFVKNAGSLCELVYQFLTQLQLPINADVATNLYNGIAVATNNFTGTQMNADTFEMVAQLLRNGAKRSWGKRQEKKMPNVQALYKQQEERPKQEVQAHGIEAKEGTPPDWLRPKIYKGSTTV